MLLADFPDWEASELLAAFETVRFNGSRTLCRDGLTGGGWNSKVGA